MAIAALDYGRRRIGLALADTAGLAVHAVAVIERRSLSRDLDIIRTHFVELEVSEVVVGLPLNMDGSVGPAARAAQVFASQLAEATGLPIHLHDERLTSFEATDRLREASGRKKRKDRVDAVAACVILEGWLRERHAR